MLQLIAKSQLTSLSGVAQKNYFNILDKIVQKVLDDHHNPRLIKDLLQDLSSTLCILIRGVGKSVLVGNINIWICRLETVVTWQQQLQNLQMTKDYHLALLFKDSGHPCTAADPDSCFTPVSPQHFIDLFKF
ncbi:F-box only protein 25 isoform 1 [Daubentonia madagascariensis]|uniref:F-box only protein 25 isoform 1 n=1 Tax=Daubentonia madagascariensis TaxID=31869 RepID=A0ABD2D474_DAUMA